MRYLRNPCVAVNIAADGIQSEIIFDTSKTREEYRLIADNYVQKYLLNTCVGKMIFNVCYKRSITDSEVFDSVLYNVKNSVKSISPAATETDILNNFREMIRRGIDIIEILVATVKKHGAEAWLSVRMNDHHFPMIKALIQRYRMKDMKSWALTIHELILITQSKQYRNTTQRIYASFVKNTILTE